MIRIIRRWRGPVIDITGKQGICEPRSFQDKKGVPDSNRIGHGTFPVKKKLVTSFNYTVCIFHEVFHELVAVQHSLVGRDTVIYHMAESPDDINSVENQQENDTRNNHGE